MKESIYRQLARWLVLVAFIILAVFYLNSAINSAWISGESSDTHAPGLSRLATGHFCYALAALSFGLGIFKGIQTFPNATRGSAAFIVLAALLVLGPHVGRFALIDGCHDRGGNWNRATLQCSDE